MSKSVCSQNISDKADDVFPNANLRSDHLHEEKLLHEMIQIASMELKECQDLAVDCLTNRPGSSRSDASRPISVRLNRKLERHSSSLMELSLKREVWMRVDLRADLKSSSRAARAFRAKRALKGKGQSRMIENRINLHLLVRARLSTPFL